MKKKRKQANERAMAVKLTLLEDNINEEVNKQSCFCMSLKMIVWEDIKHNKGEIVY